MQHPAPAPESPPPDAGVPTLPDFGELRLKLLRFARARLYSAGLAEDAVSETLLAVLQARHDRSHPTVASQTTAWVFGVLRHKLVDQLRQQRRETPAGDDLPEPQSGSHDWFAGGAWCGLSAPAADPEQALCQRELMARVLQLCGRLPALQRQAFLMRELREEEPAEICRRLGITENYLWVLIHRARSRLRSGLQQGMPPRFGPGLGEGRPQAGTGR